MATTKKASGGSKKTTVKSSVTSTKPTTKRTVKAVATPADRKFSFSRSNLLAGGIAEFIGTFLLAAVVISLSGSPLFVALSLVGIVLVLGVISGAHVNPAITIAAWVTRKITALRAVAYIVAQVLGASLALFLLDFFAGLGPKVDESLATLQGSTNTLFSLPLLPAGSELAIALVEIIGALVLGLGVAAAIRSKDRIVAGFSVGLSLFVGLLFAAAAVSYVYGAQVGSAGGVFNPAVAIALQSLAAFSFGDFATWWPLVVYFVAPTAGAVIGFFVYDLLQSESENKKA